MNQKLEIAIAVPGMKLYPGVFQKESVGGSETAGYMMARALARRGHQVYLFCNIDKVAEDDLKVHFFPLSMFLEHAHSIPHDVCIVQRVPELFYKRTEAKLNVLWMHDLPLGRQSPTVRGAIWNVDGMFMLSDFHMKRYAEVYGLKPETLWRSRNGLDLNAVDVAASAPQRDRAILYAARPERGLENLISMMPDILKRVPDVKLRLCTYANEAEQLAPYYAKINAECAKLAPNVEFLGHLTKDKLYEAMKAARVYAYPVPAKDFHGFAEISCIAAMEAQACGLPIVATKHGALPETVHPNAGILVDGLPWEEKPRAEFIDNICSILTNDEQMQFMSDAGAAHARSLGWDSVAAEWEEKFINEIKARTGIDDDRGAFRLARHLWRMGDIEALKYLRPRVMALGTDLDDAIGSMMAPFNVIPPAVPKPEKFEAMMKTPLCDVAVKFINGHKEIKRVVEFGCGMGAGVLRIANDTGVEILGVESRDAFRDIALQKRDELAKDKTRVLFESFGPEADTFDMVLCQHSLGEERNIDGAVAHMEALVKPGGYVYMTLPFGPIDFEEKPRRRVWNFDKHDIRDLFGAKPELTIHAIMVGRQRDLDVPIGWWIVAYKADHKPLGAIDMDRKLWLQRPRQTLSVSMILGGSAVEDTIHWAIRPMQHLADEIIIADCGMSEEALRIVKEYPVTIVKGINPTTEGFETARNLALAPCRMDWTWWSDADEKLLDPSCVNKYLRTNELNGYGVQQHHFAADTQWHPDLPVRLFRNHLGIRFFGMIHEHPELELNKGPGPSIVAGDLNIAHLGYLIESTRKDRFNRNWPMLEADQKKYPSRELQKMFMIRDTMLLVQNAMAKSGGAVSDKMKEKLELVITLYREHYLEKAVLSKNLDATDYYSAAVGLLGRGFEVVFMIEADKESWQGTPQPHRVRFDTEDDCLRFFAARVKSKIQPFISKDF